MELCGGCGAHVVKRNMEKFTFPNTELTYPLHTELLWDEVVGGIVNSSGIVDAV